MARPPSATRPALLSFALGVLYAVVAGLTLVFGTVLIYAFGAGYFGDFSVPTPLNFVIAPVLELGLILALWRFITHRF